MQLVRAPEPHGAAGRGTGGAGSQVAAVVGGCVNYEDTPVKPYDEIIKTVGLLAGHGVAVTVLFIAVDSAASVVDGRVNWALPRPSPISPGRRRVR